MSWISLIILITMTDLTCNMNHVPSIASSNFLMLFSHSDLSDSCDSMYSKNPGLTCHSNLPAFYSKPCPLSQRCFSAISPSVVPFFSCTQSFPASVSSQWFSSWPQEADIWLFMCSISPSENNLKSFPSHFISLNSILTCPLQPSCCKASIFWQSVLVLLLTPL